MSHLVIHPSGFPVCITTKTKRKQIIISLLFTFTQVVLRRFSQFIELDRELRHIPIFSHSACRTAPNVPIYQPSFSHIFCFYFVHKSPLSLFLIVNHLFKICRSPFFLTEISIRNFFAGKEQVALVPSLPPKSNKLFTNHTDPAFVEVSDMWTKRFARLPAASIRIVGPNHEFFFLSFSSIVTPVCV
jgi:hypothetical protein